MFCRFCGATLPDDSTFCTACGKAVATTPTPAGTNPAAAPVPAPLPVEAMPAKYATERKVLIGGMVAAAVVAVVALVLYLQSSRNRESRQSEGSPGILDGVTGNLKRSRRAANEAAAAANVRSLIAAETTFATTFPSSGYASSLFQLGPGAETCVAPHPDTTNACMIDFTLGCREGVSGAFCEKDNYKYEITAIGAGPPFTDFVITATPADNDAGGKDFCASSEGVVRWRDNADPPSRPVSTVGECTAWSPI